MKKIALLLLLPLLLAIGCSDDKDKKEISLKEDKTTLNHTGSYQINASSDSKISYTSENEYHATVDKGTGLVKAGKVGETDIVLRNENDEKKFRVTVKPVSTLYDTPSIVWGTSKADLIKQYGEPDYHDEESLIISYVNVAKEQIMMFSLDEDDKLISSAVAVSADDVEELILFLNERYVVLEAGETGIFIDGLTEELSSMAVLLGVTDDESYIIAVYLPTDGVWENRSSKNVVGKTAFASAVKELKK